MRKFNVALLAAILVCGAGGCARMIWPNWSHPGPASYQQCQAQQYDPYPENEPGPAIVGSRPRDYQKPVPETPRVQRKQWPWSR